MISVNDVNVVKTNTILSQLESAIITKQPFGLVRFGDGTIKAIHSFLTNDIEQIAEISKQEGIPIQNFERIIEFWKTSANLCDYIDTPEVYFSGKFWERTRKKKKQMSEKTLKRLKEWKKLYDRIGITNENYCNPEVNYLSCILRTNMKTLPDIMKNRKICCITSRIDVKIKLGRMYDIDLVKIPGKNENQYISINRIINLIDNKATKYDLWLIAAGELGRIYPGLIKFKGGRAFDVGSLIDFWCTREVPSRLKPYMQETIHSPLKLILTEEGMEFYNYI
jgi:hypothetical protein